ncbi:MAG TPA: hypothetical protein PLZ95_09400 [Bryobacteraceae bacterium]|nr:hypothetical protein [Bryobacteraceae bacterium]
MRLMFASLALAGLGWTLEAQDTVKVPSPLIFGGEFLHDARMQDVESLSAAIRLELEGDPKALQRDARLPALARVTERALQANSNNFGWVYGARLLAFLRGAEWGPDLDVAISLKFDLDRGVIAPGGLLRARLERIFRTKDQASAQLQFSVVDSSGKTLWRSDPMTVPPEDPIDVALPVRALPEGAYTAVYSLLAGGPGPLVTGTRPFLIDSAWRKRASELAQAARLLALKGVPAGSAREASAFLFLQWTALAMASQANGESVGGIDTPHPAIETWASHKTPRFWSAPLSAADAARAQSYASRLQSSANPLAGMEDLRLAFTSGADQSLRTFRLLLPVTLPSDKPVPLVVVLHGFAGDESSWLDQLPDVGPALRRLAHDRAFAVLAPSARSRYSRFDGPDLADLDQLRQLVSRIRPINPARTALIGHGPAAFAAINAALASPQTWPIAVGVAGLPQGLPVAKPGVLPRLLFEYAAEDQLFSVTEARKWAYLLEKRIPGFTSRELSGASNAQAPAASIERAIAFILEPASQIMSVPEAAKK